MKNEILNAVCGIMGSTTGLCWLMLCLAAPATPALAQRFATGGPYQTPAGQSPSADLLRDVGIDQHLETLLPLDSILRDETGQAVWLSQYFDKRPVVLALVQYRCPMLCTQVLNGFFKSSQGMPLDVGRDYDLVVISFDPREDHELAAEKKQHYVRMSRRADAQSGIHFLTADQPTIDRITEAVGFRYRYIERTDQFAHASGITIVTPAGRIARYLYGIEYSPNDLRLGLVEASNGQIGTPVDQILLLCYHYDPLTGKYGLAIAAMLRTAGLVTIAILGYFLVTMYRRERAMPKLTRDDADGNPVVTLPETSPEGLE